MELWEGLLAWLVWLCVFSYYENCIKQTRRIIKMWRKDLSSTESYTYYIQMGAHTLRIYIFVTSKKSNLFNRLVQKQICNILIQLRKFPNSDERITFIHYTHIFSHVSRSKKWRRLASMKNFLTTGGVKMILWLAE